MYNSKPLRYHPPPGGGMHTRLTSYPAHAQACLPAHSSGSTSESPPHTCPASQSPPGIPAASSTEYPPPSPSDPAPDPPASLMPTRAFLHMDVARRARANPAARMVEKDSIVLRHIEKRHRPPMPLIRQRVELETPPSCPRAKTSPAPCPRRRASTNRLQQTYLFRHKPHSKLRSGPATSRYI